MYKSILIPIDGSTLSLKAARAGIELARETGAKVTALHVMAPYAPAYAGEGMFYSNAFTKEQYVATMHANADKMLAKVEALAAKGQVKCAKQAAFFDTPWEGIIKTAGKLKCDTIVMASHGRGGLAGIIIGSQTNRVLTHSKIPVLVCR
jgi:nucleotide-binding universal stress UspA family protein